MRTETLYHPSVPGKSLAPRFILFSQIYSVLKHLVHWHYHEEVDLSEITSQALFPECYKNIRMLLPEIDAD